MHSGIENRYQWPGPAADYDFGNAAWLGDR
jgi:hypothetical protein